MTTRRTLFKIAGAGLTSSLVTQKLKASETANPHFFIHINIDGGLDSSYTFDARPLLFTQHGKIVNYSGLDPVLWEDSKGGVTLVSPLMKPLFDLRSDFSIINGIHGATGFEGHDQNLNYQFTANASGGSSYLTALSSADAPIAAVITEEIMMNVNNSSLLRTNMDQMKNISKVMKSFSTESSQNPLVTASYARNSKDQSLFAKGVRQMISGLNGIGRMSQRLTEVRYPDQESESLFLKQVQLMIGLFRAGVTHSALANIEYDSEEYETDTHDEESARKMPETAKHMASEIAAVIKLLKSTPYDETKGLSFFDVTTLTVSSDFSRTMRQTGRKIDKSGTDHNQLNNTMLIMGKGIKGGRIFGKSDLNALNPDGSFKDVSKNHQLFDAAQVKLMGLPFHFEAGKQRALFRDSFDGLNKVHYLTPANVANTLLHLAGNNRVRMKVGPRLNKVPAKILFDLLT